MRECLTASEPTDTGVIIRTLVEGIEVTPDKDDTSRSTLRPQDNSIEVGPRFRTKQGSYELSLYRPKKRGGLRA